MGRITGLGGIFIKVKDAAATRAWYQTHFGICEEEWGHVFPWWDGDTPPSRGAYSVLGVFKEQNDYFDPSTWPVMINFRVDDLDGMIQKLKGQNVELVGELHEEETGRFAWIMDPNGIKIELWQPPLEQA